MLREEFLGECQGQRGGDPADLHDGQEAGLHGGLNLVECSRTGYDCHRGEVDGILDWGDLLINNKRELYIVSRSSFESEKDWVLICTYDQVADEDLQDLSFQAGAASE